MDDVLNVIVLVLIIAWAVGFFAFSIGGYIHIVLPIALLALFFRVRKYMKTT